jgi:hypothetical protein
MEEARSRLRASAYRLLRRCYRAGLLDEAAVRAACDRLGIVVESEDLERAHGGGERRPPPAGDLAENAGMRGGGPRPSKRRR